MYLNLLLTALLVIHFTTTMSMSSVPERMFLTASMAAANLRRGVVSSKVDFYFTLV